MYEIIKKLIPSTLIRHNEKLLRRLISVFYSGNNYQCPICDFKMSHFITLKNTNKLCPKCGSLPRTRRLWSILENKIEGKNILHFSPSKSIRNKIESFSNIKYTTTDYAGEFDAMKKLNIESIDEPDHTFDVIICYHVLEHIEHDIKAMKELKRILKNNGICIIQTPFKSGEIYENDAVKTDQERLLHFGQKDHLRIYSAEGLMKRLESVGFITSIEKHESLENNKYGYSTHENVIIAQKTTN